VIGADRQALLAMPHAPFGLVPGRAYTDIQPEPLPGGKVNLEAIEGVRVKSMMLGFG
jgi:hypothetical protein